MKAETLKKHTRPVACQTVTVTVTGNITEVRYCTNRRGCSIEKLDKENYVNLATGELKSFEHHEKRIDDFSSIRQTLNRLRQLINCNVTEATHCKWLTLTYKENMQKAERLYSDFKQFNARLRYWLQTHNMPTYQYIAVAEPQRRGSFHLHIYLVFPSAAPYIHYNIFREKWQQGAITVNALDNIDNVGAYLMPYLTNISLEDGISDGNIKGDIKTVEQEDENGGKTTKAYIKGGRLKYYPAGFRLYRASRGIKRPIVYDCSESEAMEFVGGSKLTFEKTIKLYSEESGEVFNTINYRQFNKKGGISRE